MKKNPAPLCEQTPNTCETTAALQRIPLVDFGRGFAVCMMIVYHFCYDLTYFGFAKFNMLTDMRWIAWRNTIVTSFLLFVGLSLVLAKKQSQRGYWRRLFQVGGCALLISLVSAVMFRERFIYFGILHFIASATILMSPLLKMEKWAFIAGIALILVGIFVQIPVMDSRWLNWIGLASVKPATEDYVPLLPWSGVVLIGLGIANRWQQHGFVVHSGISKNLVYIPKRVFRSVSWLGRQSLWVYMLHQPVLMGCLALAHKITKA